MKVWMPAAIMAALMLACSDPMEGVLGLEAEVGPCATPQQEWVFGDEDWYESPRFVASWGDGQLVVASEATTGNFDYVNIIRRVTTGGALVWESRLAGPEVPNPKALGNYLDHGSQTMTDVHAVLPASDGGMVVVGSAGYTIDIPDLWLTRLDADGNEVWRHVQPEQGAQYALASRLLDTGDVVVVGVSRVGLHASAAQGIPKRAADVRVLRVDAAGEVVNTSLHGGTQEEWLLSAGVLADGSGVFVAEADADPRTGAKQFWLGGTGPDTSLTWERTVSHPYAPVAVATHSGPLLARAEADAVIVEALEAATGESRWEASLAVSVDASELRVVHDATGVWVGQVADGQLWVARLDNDGNIVWDSSFDADVGLVDALTTTSEGGVVALGRREERTGFVLVTQALSADGAVSWTTERAPSSIEGTIWRVAVAEGDAYTLGTGPDATTGLVHLGPDCGAGR